MKKIFPFLFILFFLGAGCSNLKNADQKQTGGSDSAIEDSGLTKKQGEAVPAPQAISILDYYYALPSKYVMYLREGNIGESSSARDSVIATKDLKNYYLRLQKPGDEVNSDIAVFLAPDADNLVAVSSRACGPVCEEEFYLLKYDGQNWTNMTSQLLPKMNSNELIGKLRAALSEAGENVSTDQTLSYTLHYELPRYGTTIPVSAQVTEPVLFDTDALYELKWSNGKFVVVK